jgi:glycosyltransferase involved in cell wall biosynthesis
MKIAGCGNDEGLLRKMVSDLGLDSRVEFIGRVSELGTLYEWANTTVMPCRWQEPFGLVGIESMSHARPVVAFDVGGISEWLRDGENGYLVRHGDVRALADTLDKLAGAEEALRKMGAAGLAMVRSGYSDESFLKGFLKSLEI